MPMPTLDKKQTIVVSLLIAVLGILAWQVYTMFFETASIPAPSKPVIAPAPVKVVKNTITSPTAAPATANDTAVSTVVSDPNQQKYLSLLEEYKIAELQKMIAQDKQAIAASQAATAEAIAKMNQLGINANAVDFGFNAKSTSSSTSAGGSLSLVYTGLEDGQWTATLKRGNDTFDVMEGTVIDNSKVIHIDNNEVVLANPEHITHISFDGTTSVLTAKAEALAKPAQSQPAAAPAKNTKPEAPAAAKTLATEKTSSAEPTKVDDGIVQTPALPVAPISIKQSTPATTKVSAAPAPEAKQHPSAAAMTLPKKSEAQPEKPAVQKPAHIAAKPKTTEEQHAAPAPTIANMNKALHQFVQWVANKIHPNQKAEYFFENTPAPIQNVTVHTAAPVTPTTNHLKVTSSSATSAAKSPAVTPSAKTAVIAPSTAAISSDTGYTIQLATLTPDHLDSFTQSKVLANYAQEYKVYKKTSGTHVHYIVVLGSYPTRQAAEQAYNQLPKSLLAGEPYIRPIADVKHDTDQDQ